MAAISEDLDVFLADHGELCTVTGKPSFLAIFDMPGQVIGLGHVDAVSNEYSILCKTTDAIAAALAHGVVVTVSGKGGGIAYTVRERLPEDDGAFTRFTLKV